MRQKIQMCMLILISITQSPSLYCYSDHELLFLLICHADPESDNIHFIFTETCYKNTGKITLKSKKKNENSNE